MAKQYYIKKNPATSGPDVEWIAINGKEFYQLITSPVGRGRYFIDMDDFIIEASETEYVEWRREKNHSDYLRKQEKEIQMLSLHTDMRSRDGGSEEDVRDLGTDTEAQAIASIARKALNTALNSLDPESYLIIDCLKTIRELKAIGVGVCFEEQNIDTSKMTGELLTAAFSAIAQKESESISQNIRWSYRHRMESGTFLPPSVPFGYRIENHKMVVNEEQADTIRRIFRDYLAGQSMDKIVSRLNHENPSGEKRRWNISAISYILTNERYTGDSLWQKTYATDTLPTRQVRNHGEREQYFAEATHAPIIEKKVFQAVQELKRERVEKYGARDQRQGSPLQGKISCGECGSRFRKKVCRGVVYWACLGHDKDRQKLTRTRLMRSAAGCFSN